MGAKSKEARIIRTQGEFEMANLLRQLPRPTTSFAGFSWSLDEIIAARNDLMRGQFSRPARLAKATKTDDAIFGPFQNRLAPQECIAVEMRPAKGARGKAIAGESESLFGEGGIAISEQTQSDVTAAIADFGIGIAQCNWLPREDGTRVDVVASAWPMEFVRWDETKRTYMTRVHNGQEEPIVHGDGRWLIFSKTENEPWMRGALIAAALVWARHAFGVVDHAKASKAHGDAKMIGELPKGVPLTEKDADGRLKFSAEAQAFIDMLRGLIDGDVVAGIRPAESKTEFVTSQSSAWQIFTELIQRAEKAAARIYLGTDGMLGASGGAPGVDIGALFGVSEVIYQSDLRCLQRGWNTLIEIWTAINFGDSTLAPKRRFSVPDPDQDAKVESYDKRSVAFFAHVKAAKESGFVIDQEYVDALAKKYRVDAPKILVADSGSTMQPPPGEDEAPSDTPAAA